MSYIHWIVGCLPRLYVSSTFGNLIEKKKRKKAVCCTLVIVCRRFLPLPHTHTHTHTPRGRAAARILPAQKQSSSVPYPLYMRPASF